MISGILIFNGNADLVISRFYKSDYSRVAAEAFRMKVVATKNFTSPILLLDRSSFMYIKSNDLIIAAATKQNAHVNLVFEFLYRLVDVFTSYFDGEFSEDKIRSNFVLIYELFDEVMDHGYPQIVDPELLQKFIHHGKSKNIKKSALEVTLICSIEMHIKTKYSICRKTAGKIIFECFSKKHKKITTIYI